MRVVYLAFLVACLSIPSAMAGTAEDPEVVDPVGDVAAEGAPVPAGAEWADVVRVWFEPGAGVVTMHLEVQGAPPTVGFYGEVASFLAIGDAFFHVGWTTVLPPASGEPYHGGFVCPSDSAGTVDPATCESLAGAALSGALFSVPLAADRFGWQAGSTIQVLRAYSDVWYLAAQVVLDQTAEGRPFVVPAAAGAATGANGTEPVGATGSPPVDPPQAPGRPERPAEARESPFAAGPTLLVVLVGVAFLVRAVRRSC